MAASSPVYDTNDEEPVTRPDLRTQEGIGTNATGGGRGDKKNAKKGAGQAGDKTGEGADQPQIGTGSTSSTGTGSNQNESAADKNSKSKTKDDFEFNPQYPSHRGSARRVLKAAGKHRKVMWIGTGIAGSTIGTGVVVFFMLIPLKIESITTNLQNKMFASSENAVSNEESNMLSDYVKRAVLPALTKCRGTSVDKRCNPVFGQTDNPVDALYKGWSQARLENKLATDYGIEFRAVKHGSVTKYYMKAPTIKNPNGDDITKFQT